MEINQTGEVCPAAGAVAERDAQPNAERLKFPTRLSQEIYAGVDIAKHLYAEIDGVVVEIGNRTQALKAAEKDLGPEHPKTRRASNRLEKALQKWARKAEAFDETVSTLRDNINAAKDERLAAGIGPSEDLVTTLDQLLDAVDEDLMPMVLKGRRVALKVLATQHPDRAERKKASDQLFMMDVEDHLQLEIDEVDPAELIKISTTMIERFENDPGWADEEGQQKLSALRMSIQNIRAQMELEKKEQEAAA